MKKWWIIAGISAALAVQLQAAVCGDRGFDLVTQDVGVSAEEVIKQLASECSYSIFLKDEEARARLKIDMPALNIRQAPLEQIFDLVLKENGLYYEFDGKALKISYLVTKTFKIDYVGTDRSGISTTNISINRDEGGAESSTNSTKNAYNNNSDTATSSFGGSKSGIDIRAEDGFRFWDGIQAEIEAILNRPGDFYNYFVASGASTNASQLQPQNISISNNTPPSPTEADATQGIQNALSQIPQAASNSIGAVSTPSGAYIYPSAALSTVATSQSTQAAQLARPTRSQAGFVTVNRGAGLITVTGTSEQISRVSKYIDELHERLQGQVMIDVSILTVRHGRGSTTGIDWNQLYNLQNVAILPKGSGSSYGGGSGGSGGATLAPGEIQMTDESGMLIMGHGSDISKAGYALNIFSQGVTLTRVVEFLKTYGDVTSVSNPKVLTLNNQPAMISVGDTIRYRQSTVFQTSGSSSTNTNSSTSYPSVFAGVLLDITPSVQNGEIMLKINPSITSVKSTVVESAATALDSPPNLSINQLSSIVKVKDGEKIILGGLIRKSNNKRENKVPLLGDIPLLGYFFSYEADNETTDEMVIVITPHIVKGNNGPSLQDLGYSIMGRNPLE